MSEVRQRWRLTFARDEDARYLSHLDAVHQWERAFRRARIPVATSEGFSPRPRLIFAAPLQLGMLAEHDLADLYMAERLTAADLRRRLIDGLPRGYRLVDIHDVWTGAPALAPQLSAADYRLTLFNVERPRLQEAVDRILAAERLQRVRRRESKTTTYDLRPLVLGLRCVEPDLTAHTETNRDTPAAGAAAAGATSAGATAAAGLGQDRAPMAGLWLRLRHSQDRGSGRPDEVVAALAEYLGLEIYAPADDTDDAAQTDDGRRLATGGGERSRPSALEVLRPIRERLWLVDEVD